MKLEGADAVVLSCQHRRAVRIEQPALQQFCARISGAAFEVSWIRAESQIETHRPDGRAVADAEPDRVDHIVEPENFLRLQRAVHIYESRLMGLRVAKR